MSRFIKVIFLLVGICVILLIPYNIYKFLVPHDVIMTVTDKYRHEDGYYLILGEDESGESVSLKNEDVKLRFKFDSTDFQQMIKIGKKYRFTVIGYRLRIKSQYENIIAFEEIK